MSFDPATEHYVNLATYRRDGSEVRTPVWIAVHDGVPVIYTNGTSWKVKRIRNNHQIRLAPCTARGHIRGDWVEATATIVEDEDRIDRGVRAFIDKYGWQMRLVLLLSRLSGRYEDRVIIELELPNR